MSLKGIIKRTGFTLLGIILIVLIILGIKLYSILNADQIPYRDITDGYNYIYTDVKHNNFRYTIIIEGGLLYGSMRHYMYKDDYSQFSYMFHIDHALRHNKPIEINDTLHYFFKSMKVNKSLIKKYNNINFIRKNCLDSDSYLKRSLVHTEDCYAIIYVLLKNNITCSRNCESGYPYIAWDYDKK